MKSYFATANNGYPWQRSFWDRGVAGLTLSEEQLRYGTPQNANAIAYWPGGGSSWVQLLDPKCDLALAAEEIGAEEINLFFCERISA